MTAAFQRYVVLSRRGVYPFPARLASMKAAPNFVGYQAIQASTESTEMGEKRER